MPVSILQQVEVRKAQVRAAESEGVMTAKRLA